MLADAQRLGADFGVRHRRRQVSFDIAKHKHNHIELYGAEGSLVTPDPNTFTGGVELFRRGDADWRRVPVDHPYVQGAPGRLGLRGLGAAEMIDAYRSGRTTRASWELAFHALEVLTALEASQGSAIDIKSRCEGRADPHDTREGSFGDIEPLAARASG
jgi:predicted dehydrogenase